MSSHSRRAALSILTLASIGAALVGCGSPAVESNSDVTLSVWGWRQEDVAAYKSIFSKFEESHPGIKVEYVPYLNTEYDKILSTGLTDSKGPDVAQLRSYGLLQPLVESGSLVKLDDKVSELSGFPASVLDGAKGVSDGAVYGVPFAIQTLHVLYNETIFKDHGITVPTTWNEMTAAFNKLQDAGVTPMANTVTDTWMLPIEQEIFGAGTYGGTAYLDKMLKGEAKFTDAPWVDSVNTWLSTKKFWGSSYEGRTYADAQALFSSGQAATFPGGIWEVAAFRTTNPDLKIGIFNVPSPSGDGAPMVPGYVDGSFGVSAKAAHPKEALELVKWMATKEFGQAFTDKLSQISPVPGVESSDPVLAAAVAAYAKNPSPYVTYAYFSGGTPTAWDLAASAFSKAVLGQIDGAKAAAEIQTGVDQWFKPSK